MVGVEARRENGQAIPRGDVIERMTQIPASEPGVSVVCRERARVMPSPPLPAALPRYVRMPAARVEEML